MITALIVVAVGFVVHIPCAIFWLCCISHFHRKYLLLKREQAKITKKKQKIEAKSAVTLARLQMALQMMIYEIKIGGNRKEVMDALESQKDMFFEEHQATLAELDGLIEEVNEITID